MDNISNCKLCGNTACFISARDNEGIICSKCGLNIERGDKDIALEAWNNKEGQKIFMGNVRDLIVKHSYENVETSCQVDICNLFSELDKLLREDV